MTYTYSSTQVAGRWVVSSIARNDGVDADFAYANDTLASVTYNDGSQATYDFEYDEALDLNKLNVVDPNSRNGTGICYYTTISLAETPQEFSPSINVQVPNQILMVRSLDDETRLEILFPDNTAIDAKMVVREGVAC